MLLSELPKGALAKIVKVNGGVGMRDKLALRGIAENKIIRVISQHPGPVIIEVNRNTIAIGRGMANKIRVIRI